MVKLKSYRQIGYVEKVGTLTIGPIGEDYITEQKSEGTAKKFSRLQRQRWWSQQSHQVNVIFCIPFGYDSDHTHRFWNERRGPATVLCGWVNLASPFVMRAS